MHDYDMLPSSHGGLQRSSAMPCLFIHVIYAISLSLYPFTERYGQPYFIFMSYTAEGRYNFGIRARGVTILPTKIELTLEQSQQGVSNDVLVSLEGVEELKRNVWIKGENKAALHYT
nr:hypothetical protein [Tanacetum cinerariifolium]